MVHILSLHTLTAIALALLQGMTSAQPILPSAPPSGYDIVTSSTSAVPLPEVPTTIGSDSDARRPELSTPPAADISNIAMPSEFQLGPDQLPGAYTCFIQVAAGTSPGAPINSITIATDTGAYTGFDVRPKIGAASYASSIKGYSSNSIWDKESLKRAETRSSKAFESNGVSGAVSSSTETSEKVHAEDTLKLSFFDFDAEQSFGYDSTDKSSKKIASAYTYRCVCYGPHAW